MSAKTETRIETTAPRGDMGSSHECQSNNSQRIDDVRTPSGESRPPVSLREFLERCSVLEVGPLHMEVIKDLRWAREQEAIGAFDVYAGRYLGIVNRTLHSVGGDPGTVIEDAAKKAGVPENRVALFHIEFAE